MQKAKGFIFAILAAAIFGCIPIFTRPLMDEGMDVGSILTLRLFIASIAVALIILIKREHFGIDRRELIDLAILAVCYFFSALLLFEGFNQMSGGIATVLHFSYPVFTALIMRVFFKQYISPITMVAIALSLTGASLLMGIFSEDYGGGTPLWASIMVIASGAAYATYLVLINNRPRMRKMKNHRLTFYVLIFSCAYFLAYTLISKGTVVLPPSGNAWGNIILLALFPTLLSNLFLVAAVKRIGSTLLSVLGVIEPLTALTLGAVFLGETISTQSIIGAFVVIAAVILIILAPSIDSKVRQRLERFSLTRTR